MCIANTSLSVSLVFRFIYRIFCHPDTFNILEAASVKHFLYGSKFCIVFGKAFPNQD